MHGTEKAAAMTKDFMQSWQQNGQMHPEGQVPIHSAPASSTTFASAGSLQSHSQSQIPNHNVPSEVASATPQMPLRWVSARTIPQDERSITSLPPVVAPSAPALPLHLHTDNSASQTNVAQHQEFPISHVVKEETPTTATHFPSTFPTAPSSQSHSILSAPEEKSSALYTMRGLAASIKRSLNAERRAASEQATAAPETNAEIRKRSPSDEAVDTTEQSGLANARSNEPAISPTTESVETVPVLALDDPSSATILSPLPQGSVSQRETPSSIDEAIVPNSYQEPLHDFVPFSTLAGAVSFDNATSYAPVDHPIPSPATTPLEGLMNPRQAPDLAPHDHMDVPLLSFEASLNALSFPTRTPTPPLSAMITPFRDDDGANEKTQETSSSNPTSPRLDQVELQPESISPASNGFEAMDICTNEDQDGIDLNVPSLSSEHATHPEVQILDSPAEEPDVFVRRTGLLDSSIEEISGEALENLRAEGSAEDETRNLVRTSEVPSAVHTSTRPTSGGSTSHAATLGSSVSLKPAVKSAGKPSFYIAVPPQPEWVRNAKRQEAAKKGLASEENGEFVYFGTTLLVSHLFRAAQ
jgi:hypothetical protein